MSIFKRLSATVAANLDRVVGEIENNDAVIQANLTELRRKVAAAKVRLAHVHRQEARLNKQIQKRRNDEQLWGERAVETARTDEERALECVRRRQQCRLQAEKLEQGQQHYQLTAEKLARGVEEGEERLAEMGQKHTLMRARQSTAEALYAANLAGDDSLNQMEDSFDRWEVKILQEEMAVDSDEALAPLDREFSNSENEQALREELAALIAKEQGHEH
jgi:phage shock protein A